MDFAKSLLEGNQCNEEGVQVNPLISAMDHLLIGQDMSYLYQAQQSEYNFQDHWEMEQVQIPQNMELAWQDSIKQQQIEQAWQHSHDETAQMVQEMLSLKDPINFSTTEPEQSKTNKLEQLWQVSHDETAQMVQDMLSLQDPLIQNSQFMQRLRETQLDELKESLESSVQSIEQTMKQSQQQKSFDQIRGERFIQRWQEMWQNEIIDVKEYQFAHFNPFITDFDPQKTAEDKLRQGELGEAILALESQLLNNINQSDVWTELGKLHQMNDDDNKAISAFMRGNQVDPYNYENLLNLAIGFLNFQVTEHALMCLQSWISINPNYAMLKIPDEIENSEQLYEILSNCQIEDPQLNEVLGALSLPHKIERATQHFIEALKSNPTNYILWNKVGALLSNQMHIEKAIQHYQTALDLFPTYTRAWVNLGIAQANQGNWIQAISNYLTALNLNPDAKHIWNYVTTAFCNIQRMDLVEKCELQDVNMFNNEFKIFTRADIPNPGEIED